MPLLIDDMTVFLGSPMRRRFAPASSLRIQNRYRLSLKALAHGVAVGARAHVQGNPVAGDCTTERVFRVIYARAPHVCENGSSGAGTPIRVRLTPTQTEPPSVATTTE
jgi:hypothetical protein